MNLALRIITIYTGDPVENSDLGQQEARQA